MSDRTLVVNLKEAVLNKRSQGDGFESENTAIGQLLGLSHLGAQLYRVPPRKKAWPYHCHYTNDELFVILEGEGTMRFGETRQNVRAGDVVGCPAGGPGTAHQLVNSGTADLVYLCISSMHHPEVMEYPDSSKMGVLVGNAALGPEKSSFRFFGRRSGGETSYWDGES